MAKAKEEPRAKDEPFEKMLAKLEEIVSKLERDDVPLEDAIKIYEEGIRIHATCSRVLEEAQQKIEKLTAAPPPPARPEPEGVADEEDGVLPF